MSTQDIKPAGIAMLCVACAMSSVACTPPVEGTHSPQGRQLIGGSLPWLAVSTNDASGADGLALDGLEVREARILGRRGAIVLSGAGSTLEGATLHGTARKADKLFAVQLQIVRICPHARPPLDWAPPEGWVGPEGCAVPFGWTGAGGGEEDYEVLYRKDDSEPWSPLCDPGWNRAVPAAGTWSPNDGGHADDATQLTLACQDGVIAKCLNWGYEPWEHRDLHQACTRMARADYCASGKSHTVDGTIIGMTDRLHIRTDTAGLKREASWTPDGEVICLSKERWNSLRPGGPRDCASPMRDPRIDPTALYCEEMDLADDLLTSSSNLVDVGLYLWTSGKDTFTTSRFFFDGPDTVVPPGPEYDTTAVFAGTVYRPDLDEKHRRGTLPLISYLGPSGDHLTTTQEPPPDYALVAVEGYIFPSGSPDKGRAPLHTWRHEDTGDHLTSADQHDWGPQTCVELDAEGACLPGSRHNPENGFVYVRLEGYLPTLDIR